MASASSKRKRKTPESDVSLSIDQETSNRSTAHSNKQACDACRHRKIRCDGDKPRCSYCVFKKQDCVYGPLYKRAQCSQAYVEDLESRLREFERASSIGQRSENTEVSQNTPNANTGGGLASYDPAQDHFRPQVAQASSTRQSDTPSVQGDHPTPSRNGQSAGGRRYGKSSSLQFALHLKASTNAMNLNATNSPDSNVQDEYLRQSPPHDEVEDAEEDEDYDASHVWPRQMMSALLPYRRLANVLFSRYFESIHPIWPFLLEGETHERFTQTWTSNETPEILWLVQLNLIMALGSLNFIADSKDSQITNVDVRNAGEEFFHRAQDYVKANAFTTTSLMMLQALLLMSIYQQSLMRFSEFYLTVGHAARMAQSLGLHVSRPERAPITPLKRELHRRLWWSCYCQDRLSSLLFGRPVGIPYGEFSDYQDLLPREIDDDFIAQGVDQPTDRPSFHSFLRHTVRLYHVMDNLLLRLRGAKTAAYFEITRASKDIRINRPVSGANVMINLFTTILELDGHLLSWHEYLPPHLKFSLHSPDAITEDIPAWLRRQKHTLRTQFLGMRLLLHRQTLLFLLQPPQRREWPQNGIQEWPPLFSDCNSDTLVGGSTPFRQHGTPSQSETSLTHLSASICAASALLQIQSLDEYLAYRYSGDRWMDLNATFTSLCVLCGVMALNHQDLRAVVPDLPKAHDIIRRGFSIMHLIAVAGDKRAQKSEQFLQRLALATLKRNKQNNSFEGEMHSDSLDPHATMDSTTINGSVAPAQSAAAAFFSAIEPHEEAPSSSDGTYVPSKDCNPNLQYSYNGSDSRQRSQAPLVPVIDTFAGDSRPSTRVDAQTQSIQNSEWFPFDAAYLESMNAYSPLPPVENNPSALIDRESLSGPAGPWGTSTSSRTSPLDETYLPNTGTGQEAILNVETFHQDPSDSIQSLFYNSFDLWGVFDDQANQNWGS